MTFRFSRASRLFILGALVAFGLVQVVSFFRADPAKGADFTVLVTDGGLQTPNGLNADFDIDVGDTVIFRWDASAVNTHGVFTDEEIYDGFPVCSTGVHTGPYEDSCTFTDDATLHFSDIADPENFTFTLTVGAGGGGNGGEPVELFEGWNPIEEWEGPSLNGDAITNYLNSHINPNAWTSAAYYTGTMWQQRFQDPPLPSFNTLNSLSEGQHGLWIFLEAPSAILSH